MKLFVALMLICFVTVAGVAPVAAAPPDLANNGGNGNGNGACYGQAAAAFAQMGEMGEHSSSFPTPRLGLRNLARSLAEAGAIPDDSMQSLGAFVADQLGLTIEACM
jgi:hypothetical protein